MSEKGLGWAGLSRGPLSASLLLVTRDKIKLDDLSLQIHHSKLLLLLVWFCAHFKHKLILPRADANTRARGPQLAAVKNKILLAFLCSLPKLSTNIVPPAALKVKGGCCVVLFTASTRSCPDLARRALRTQDLDQISSPNLPLETGCSEAGEQHSRRNKLGGGSWKITLLLGTRPRGKGRAGRRGGAT